MEDSYLFKYPGILETVTGNTPDHTTVTEFENKIATFFGAPYGVAVDSCTHGLELCLILTKDKSFFCPKNTYLSVPMLSNKLGIGLIWIDEKWEKEYRISNFISDGATLWEKDGYKKCAVEYLCLSFQHQKHLSLGRGGMILTDNKEAADTLRKMAYDGRLPGIPWREQDVDIMGYHYYMTPETAALGISKLPEAINTEPRIWTSDDYPDLTKMKLWAK